jgi:hypothetical protein
LQGSDVLPAFHNGVGLTFRNCGDRVDIVDLTVGVHAEFAGNTLLRTSGVFPLAPGGDRPFDAEVQVQVERRF